MGSGEPKVRTTFNIKVFAMCVEFIFTWKFQSFPLPIGDNNLGYSPSDYDVIQPCGKKATGERQRKKQRGGWPLVKQVGDKFGFDQEREAVQCA